MLLFVGRLQALKGVDLALETLIELCRRGHDAMLAIVGGPSGPDGRDTLAELHRRVEAAGVIDHVSFVAPQAHQLLSTWMRAADVTLVPSRSESFGLVALESSACGTPVVASDVGGLTTLVEPGVNGVLLAERDAARLGRRRRVGRPTRDTRPRLSTGGVLLARRYTWRAAARHSPNWSRSWRVEPGALLSERAPLRDAAAPAHLDEVIARVGRVSGAPGARWARSSTRPEPDDRGHFHWLIRLRGEEKDFITLWLSLRQRTVHVETEVMPRPRRTARSSIATCSRATPTCASCTWRSVPRPAST